MSHFKNRQDAAEKLIPLLDKFRHDNSVVLLAVPRGGVPIAFTIAKQYHFPLELLMTKKIGYPGHKEYAIGAVNLEDEIIDRRIRVSPAYIEGEVFRIREQLKERYKQFIGHHVSLSFKNKVLIIIDDGIATGNTMLLAIKMLRNKSPKRIVVAVPVAPHEAIERFEREAEEMICLYTPEPFISVGLHYADFPQVKDQEVMQMLAALNSQLNSGNENSIKNSRYS